MLSTVRRDFPARSLVGVGVNDADWILIVRRHRPAATKLGTLLFRSSVVRWRLNLRE